MATQAIDYDALARRAGAVASVPSSPGALDYEALARKAGAVASVKAASPHQPPVSKPQETKEDDAGLQMRERAHSAAIAHMDRDLESEGYDPNHDFASDPKGFLESAKAALEGFDPRNIWKSYVHRVQNPGSGPIADSSLSDVAPIAPVMRAAQQVGTGDVSGAAGTLTGNALPIAAVHAAGVIARKAGPALNATRTAAADALETSARKNINTALNPTTKINKALTEDRLAPGMLDRKVVATSLKDLKSGAEQQIERLGSELDDAFERHADAGTAVPPAPIVEALEREKQSYIVDGVKINEPHIDRLAALQKQIEDVATANGGEIPLASARRIRQIHDAVVARSKGGFALAPDEASAIEAHKTFSDAIRTSLAEVDPELAALNREYSFWRNVDKVAGDSILRKVGQRSPLTKTVLENAGMAVGAKFGGPFGAYAGRKVGGTLGDLQTSTVWNTLSAQAKRRIASLLEVGDIDEAAQVPTSAAGPAGATRALTSTAESVAPSADEPGRNRSNAGPTASETAGTGRELPDADQPVQSGGNDLSSEPRSKGSAQPEPAADLNAPTRRWAKTAEERRQLATDYAAQNPDAPLPELQKRFGVGYGAAKTIRESVQERSKAPQKISAQSENSRREYALPPSNETERSFPKNASDLEHLRAAQFTRLPLSEEDARNAIALVGNSRGFEYIHRMTTPVLDASFEPHAPLGHHFSPDRLDAIIANLELDEDQLSGKQEPALDFLLRAANEAKQGNKSLVFMNNHPDLSALVKNGAFREELNHALQRATTGPLDRHLAQNAVQFLSQKLAAKAVQSLESYGYNFRSPSEAASEIGVRLMDPTRHGELGLSGAETEGLARQYVQLLEKEYGRQKIDPLRQRINEAFR